MDAKARYHRSFISYYKYANSDCQHSCHKQVRGSKRSRFKYDLDDFRDTSSLGSGGGSTGPFGVKMPMTRDLRMKPQPHDPATQARFIAYKLVGKNMTRTYIVEKPDQDFQKYATPWERQHSKILYKLPSRESIGATPIVDDSLTVVGHMMTVSGRRLFTPVELYSISRPCNDYLEEGIPVFVGTDKEAGWTYFDASEVIYTVITSVDGEVIAFLKIDYVGVESTEFWLLDALELATGVAGVGLALGRVVVKSLARRAARKAGKKAVRELSGMTAKRAKQALARQGGRKAAKALPPTRYMPETGMTRPHFDSFRKAAQEEQVIAIVRNTNPKSTRLIELGCPGKSVELKMSTSGRTGVVTATNNAEVEAARRLGHYVVDNDGVARRQIPGVFKNRQPVYEELDLKNVFWEIEPGQVIHQKLKKPIVGDYDLMGVVDPKNVGQNIALHASKGARTKDISSPIVDRFKRNVNSKLDQNRVMHGAQDQFAGYRGGATVFHPNGDVVYLKTEADVQAFYKNLGRKTQAESYPRPGADVKVDDELARARKRRAARQTR